jgi:hypothetical protein
MHPLSPSLSTAAGIDDDDEDGDDDSDGNSMSGDEPCIIARVVTARLEGMDEAFLAALGVAADGAAGAGDEAAATRLAAVREEVLRQAGARLTPALQALDAATRAGDAAGRRAVLASTTLPPAPILFSAAAQLIDDMEAASVVPDAALLARLCLAREDVLDGSASTVLVTASAAHATMLHAGGADLAATLASNPSPAARPARRALITRACFLDGAWEAAAASAAPGGLLDPSGVGATRLPNEGLSPGAASAASEAAAKRAPRPGRTLTAIRALRDAMAKRGQQAQASALETARQDVLAVLDGVAYRGKLAVVEPAATAAAEMAQAKGKVEDGEEEEFGEVVVDV